MLYSYKSVYANLQLQQRYSKEKGTGTSIGIAIVAALLINNFILLNAKVPSGSMENTIMTGDRLFGFRLSYLMEDPKRGDIVIFKYPDNESINYIKRIIGLPGETVTIKDSKVYINDSTTPLKEDYLKEEWVIANDGMQFQVPEGCYFMMGDNRNNSKDSRYWNNTYVARDKILAKAIFRYWGQILLIMNKKTVWAAMLTRFSFYFIRIILYLCSCIDNCSSCQICLDLIYSVFLIRTICMYSNRLACTKS